VTVSHKQSHKSPTPKPAANSDAAPMAASTSTAPTPALIGNGSTIFVKLPPVDANIPVPPKGFIPTNGNDFRALLPRKVEIAVLADAVSEVQSLPDYSQIFGRTVPSQSAVTQVLSAAEQWSSMRNASTLWDLYCRTQEGLAWQSARGLVASMKASFSLAVGVDATLGTQNPSLVALFGARATIAQRGVVTRKANRDSELQGQPPTHGKAVRKAAKIAKLVATEVAKAPPAVTTSQASQLTQVPSTPVAPATVAAVTSSPVATAAPSVAVTPAVASNGLTPNAALNAAAVVPGH
jgi:hypothetical protein